MTDKILQRAYEVFNDIFDARRPSCRCVFTMPPGEHEDNCPDDPARTVKNPVLHYPTED